MRTKNKFYLKTNFNSEWYAEDIETGEAIEGTLLEIIEKNSNCLFYVENLTLIYNYIKIILFENGYKMTEFGKQEEGKSVGILCSEEKTYSLGFPNGSQIRGLDSIAPNIDIDEIDMNHDLACVKLINKCLEMGITGITIGSSAFNLWKYGDPKIAKCYEFKWSEKGFSEDIISKIRVSYKGGINTFSKKNKWCDKKNITVDCNSLYPFNLLNNVVPFGEPKFFTPEEWKDKLKRGKYKIALVTLALKATIKPGFTPTFGINDNGKYYYLDKIDGIFTMWEKELEQLKKYYDCEFYISQVLGFMAVNGKSFFGKFFDKYKKIKEEATDYETRQLAKLLLNNLIGKFATKNENYCHIETEPNHWESFKNENFDHYCALTSYVNAMSRVYMTDLIQMFGDRFIYCDTDSITFIGDKIPDFFERMINKKEFGKFKVESVNDWFHCLKCKQYAKKTEKGIKYVIAGIPKKDLENIEKFEKGVEIKRTVSTWDKKTGIPFEVTDYFTLGVEEHLQAQTKRANVHKDKGGSILASYKVIPWAENDEDMPFTFEEMKKQGNLLKWEDF